MADRLIEIGRSADRRKDYRRPIYLLERNGNSHGVIPMSRFDREHPLKRSARENPFVLFVKRGRFEKLVEDSLILIPWHQTLAVGTVAFSSPGFIEASPPGLADEVVQKMREYIDSCLEEPENV